MNKSHGEGRTDGVQKYAKGTRGRMAKGTGGQAQIIVNTSTVSAADTAFDIRKGSKSRTAFFQV